jgi:hypothetical protein
LTSLFSLEFYLYKNSGTSNSARQYIKFSTPTTAQEKQAIASGLHFNEFALNPADQGFNVIGVSKTALVNKTANADPVNDYWNQ